MDQPVFYHTYQTTFSRTICIPLVPARLDSVIRLAAFSDVPSAANKFIKAVKFCFELENVFLLLDFSTVLAFDAKELFYTHL